MDWVRHQPHAFAILALYFFSTLTITLLVYGQVINHEFLAWDDLSAYIENPKLQYLSRGNFVWMFTSYGDGIWKPITYLSFLSEFLLLPKQPGYHLIINPILHAINAELLGLLTFYLVNLKSNRDSFIKKPYDSSIFAGLAAALIFISHPMQTEAACWLSARKELLCGTFFLASIIFWLRYLHQHSKSWYFSSLLMQLIALMCKPMAISIPVILLLLSFHFEHGKTLKERLQQLLPFIMLSLFIIPIAINGQESVDALPAATDSNLLIRVDQAADTYLLFLSKFVLPFNFSPYYPAFENYKIQHLITYVAIIMLLMLFSVFYAKKNWLLFFIAAWYFITFLPVVGLIQIGGHRVADRYAYLPSMSLCIFVSIFLYQQFFSQKLIFASLTLSLVIALSSQSYHQAKIWRNDLTLWQHAFTYFPENPLIINNLGNAYLRLGMPERATPLFQQAVTLAPNRNFYYYNLILAETNSGHYEDALHNIGLAREKFPEDIGFYVQESEVYILTNHYSDAINILHKYEKTFPGTLPSDRFLWNKAYALAKLNKLDDSLKTTEALLKMYPDHKQGHELYTQLIQALNTN